MEDRYGGRLQNFWTFQNLRSIMRRSAGHGNTTEGCRSEPSMFGEWRLEQRRMLEIPATWHILEHSQIAVSPNSQMCERGFKGLPKVAVSLIYQQLHLESVREESIYKYKNFLNWRALPQAPPLGGGFAPNNPLSKLT